MFAMACLPLSLAGSLPLLQAGPECGMHVLVAGADKSSRRRCRSTRTRRRCRTRWPVRRQGLEVGAKLISTSSFLPCTSLSALPMGGEDGIEVVFDEPRAPPPAQLPSHLALYEPQYN